MVDSKLPRGKVASLALGALGVVYGDIGTSPLYALKECFGGKHGVVPDPANVHGVISLVLWSLIIVISIKYVFIVMRADNQGEGGILALLSLVCPRPEGKSGWVLVVIGLCGAALLYGDGMITPAISVLSAVEGLEMVTPFFKPFIVPITLAILALIFIVQRSGTASIGIVFGPLTLLWFLSLGALGIMGISNAPEILYSINPQYAAEFFIRNGWHGVIVMGSVFLVVTGGEALYADMGHFGRFPIRLAWYIVVLPCLVIHYFGQGALLLANPSASASPFFHLVPSWGLIPMVVLATLATCIASQAVITGAFSLTFQAVQMGYLPRFEIKHTSSEEMGQIYIPWINWGLFAATMGLVIGFRTSGNLAAAYGIAVTTTMLLTTFLAFRAMHALWGWGLASSITVSAFFLVIDLMFFGANIIKVEDGGWFPLLMGALIFIAMSTWWRGRKILSERIEDITEPLEKFMRTSAKKARKVKGTAVYLTGTRTHIPPALALNLALNGVLHERIVLLTVVMEPVPRVPVHQRLEVQDLKNGIFRVIAHNGFMNSPNIPHLLSRCSGLGLKIDLAKVTYVLGRETLLATDRPGMALWRERLFAFLSRNAHRATSFFRLPSERVVEIGTLVEL